MSDAMRLSRATLDRARPAVERPRHGADARVGIVHFGPGAFHRAHQADYVDRLLDHDRRWGIAAVSMRSRGTVEALAAQDGLYTLAIRDAEPGYRIVDAHRRFLAPDEAAETLALLADPGVGLVTTTVTEKGYCLTPEGELDLDHGDVRHDLTTPEGARASVVGWMVAGLAARRAAGVAPFVPMPCDNLASNGRKLHAALVAFARAQDAGLADWIAGEVRVPSTMVDSITPAADAALLADVEAALGLTDAAPVQREAFTQWVIEDTGAALPDFASVGATMTRDVGGYERAKLRILNGAHSTLAYAGLMRGAGSVADAMADPALAAFADRLIAEDVAPMLPPVAGLDLDGYRRAVLARFRNPAIVHRLEQIAQDGSQKLPYRLGDTLMANLSAGRVPGHVVAAYGAWIAFVIRRTREGGPIADPAADALRAAAAGGDARAAAERLARGGIGLPTGVAARGDVLDAIAAAAATAAGEGPPRP